MKTIVTLAVQHDKTLWFDAYEVNPNGRFVWLQKLANRLLQKYGKRPIVTNTTYTTETIEVDQVMAALGAIINNAAQITGDDRFVALVGQRQWAEIRKQSDVEIKVPVRDITIPIPERLARRFTEVQLRSMPGLRIIVLSWYDGIAVIPAYLWGR